MFTILAALAVIAETTATATGALIAASGPVGAIVAGATGAIGGAVGNAAMGAAAAAGIEAAAATTIGTLAGGGATTALNVEIIKEAVESEKN